MDVEELVQILNDAIQTWEDLSGRWADRAPKESGEVKQMCYAKSDEYKDKANRARNAREELQDGLSSV